MRERGERDERDREVRERCEREVREMIEREKERERERETKFISESYSMLYSLTTPGQAFSLCISSLNSQPMEYPVPC